MGYDEVFEKGLKRLEELGMKDRIDRILRKGAGAGTGQTIRWNKEYLDKFQLKWRVIDSPERANTSTEIFGCKLAAPIMSGAMSGMEDLIEEPLRKFAVGMAKAGLMAVAGIGSKEQLLTVLKECPYVVKITKPWKDNKRIIDDISFAEKNGVVAVGVDIGFFHGGSIRDRVTLRDQLGPKTVEQLKDIASTVKIPFILKDVLSIEDAKKAEKIGVDAIVVGNHGGTVLDCSASPLQILPDIKREVSEEMLILVDSGFRGGIDALKGLALGANAVIMGHLVILGLAADGAEGVTAIFKGVIEELERAMAITGCRTVKEVSIEILKHD